jgi:hypothetical protein
MVRVTVVFPLAAGIVAGEKVVVPAGGAPIALKAITSGELMADRGPVVINERSKVAGEPAGTVTLLPEPAGESVKGLPTVKLVVAVAVA